MPHVFRSALLLPLVLLLLALNLSLPDSARAEEELTARDIMQRVIDRDTGNKSIMDMEMQLIDKNDKVRKREIRSFGMDQGEDDWGVMFFLSPADTKNTGFLTYDYYEDEKDDDQWLYLPALGKEKRIASNDKSSSFMGSDLTNADFIKRKTKNYDYELLSEDEIDGHPVWKIKSIPNNEKEIKETGVLESIAWIRKDNYMSIQSVQRLEKKGRTKYFKAKEIEQVDGIWVAKELRVFTKKGKVKSHSTIIRFSNIQFNQESVTEDMFTVRRLKKGL
jgi:hypothetical protein